MTPSNTVWILLASRSTTLKEWNPPVAPANRPVPPVMVADASRVMMFGSAVNWPWPPKMPWISSPFAAVNVKTPAVTVSCVGNIDGLRK